jgi:segregation and condensation protein B
MSAVEFTPVEDFEALLALLAAAELAAAKEKSDGGEKDDDEEEDDESEDGDDSDDDDGSDDDDDDEDDEDDEEDEEEDEEEEAAEAEAVATPVEPVVASVPQVTDVVSADHPQHLRLIEALLFAGTQALDEKELADRLPNDANLPALLADLTELYANRGVNVVKVAGGYAFRTAPDLSEKLKIEKPVTRKLSRAAIETLAIIAYHQPVTRTEIEQVRGVGLSKGTLDLLFEQNWIRPMGRRRVPGRPVTWGTTDFFLEHFGLPSLDDLPGHEEMKAAGLLDPRAQPPIFRPDEPDLPLEASEDEADEPLAADETAQ